MIIEIQHNQLIKLIESIDENRIICDNCGWTWNISEGGDDVFICHKCGHDNSQID